MTLFRVVDRECGSEPNFDPIHLGKYVPRGMLELEDAHTIIVDAFNHMKATIVGDTSLAGYEKKFGSECAKLLGEFFSRLPSVSALQVFCWEYLRHELVTEFIKAYVVDISGSVNAIESSFWVTDFARTAFATGELPSTPGYPNGGVIVVTYDEHKKLFGKYFEFFVNEYWVNGDGEYICSVQGIRMDVPGPRDNLPPPDGSASQRVPIQGRGGRPASYDVEEFLIQAFIIMRDKEKPPSSQVDLARRAAEAYERAGGPGGRPSTGWARAHTQRIWAALKAANNCQKLQSEFLAVISN